MDAQYYPIEFDSAGSTFSIMNHGTAPAPCVITIIPKVDFMRLVIGGLTQSPITFTGLKTGETLIIDGEARTVKVNDADAFSQYDAWEFPKLQPGLNQIVIENGI